jgi:hypothetical protein
MISIEAQLKGLEMALLNPITRHNLAALSYVIADEFLGFAGSGHGVNKRTLIEALRVEPAPMVSIEGFRVKLVRSDLALVVYRTTPRFEAHSEAILLHTSLWILRDKRWQLAFHERNQEQADTSTRSYNASQLK